MDMAELVTDEVIEAFSRDGAVCLRAAVGREWIESLAAGLDRSLAAPSHRARLWDGDGDGGTTRYDSQCWLHIDEYRDFIENSPMAEIAGRLLGASAVNFFFDSAFVRTSGVQFRTPFHQDEPYWTVDGFDTCSAWMPLVPVERCSTLEFVAGSHRWGQRFHLPEFWLEDGEPPDDGRLPFPDIEGHRDEHEILGWAMEPGDMAIFNGRTIHGGSGNLAPDRDLRVFNTQWLGDDVRVAFRPEGMSPDHRDVMAEVGLGPGDRPGTHLYPELWRREPAPA